MAGVVARSRGLTADHDFEMTERYGVTWWRMTKTEGRHVNPERERRMKKALERARKDYR